MQIHIFDFILAGWLILFAINGYFVGFWRGIFSIIKWTFTISIFYFGYPVAGTFWKKFTSSELNIFALSGLTLFMISLIFIAWISEMAESCIHNSRFVKFINKLLGLILGTIKGIILIVALIYLMTYLEIKTDWVKDNKYGKKIIYASNKIISNDTFNSIMKNLENTSIKKQIQEIEIVL